MRGVILAAGEGTRLRQHFRDFLKLKKKIKAHILDECTKISCIEDYAVAFGKKLKQFNAVDCGLFICTKAIFSALSEAISNSLYGF
ncbi:hypothetical protein M1N51_01745 [Peptococcaceae bacterium]|nr:hypothetical protein [Peptococcaceae bacterium]